MIIKDSDIAFIKEHAGEYLAHIAEEEQADNNTLEWLSVYIWQQNTIYINKFYNADKNSDIIKAFNSCFNSLNKGKKIYRGLCIKSDNSNLSVEEVRELIISDKKYSSFTSSELVAIKFASDWRPYSFYEVVISTICDTSIPVSNYRDLNEEEFIVGPTAIEDIKIESLRYIKNIV